MVCFFFTSPPCTVKGPFFVGLSSVTTDISQALEKGSVTSSLLTHRQSHPGGAPVPAEVPPRPSRLPAGRDPPGPALAGSGGAERPRQGCRERHLPRLEWGRARGQGRFLWGSLQRFPVKRFSPNRGVCFSRFAASPPAQRILIPSKSKLP